MSQPLDVSSFSVVRNAQSAGNRCSLTWNIQEGLPEEVITEMNGVG